MTDTRQRLVHVITDLRVGGAEMMLLKLLREQNREDWELHVVSLVGGGDIQPRIEQIGVPVTSLELAPGRFSLGAWRQLRRLGRELAPDIVQGWMYHGNLAATVLAGAAPEGCRHFWSIRQSLPALADEKPLTQLVIRLGAWLSKRPEAIVYNAHVSIDHHVAVGYPREKAVYIGNGFDLDEFRPRPEARMQLRERLGVPTDAVLVGQVGRWHPVKGFDVFLAAAAEIATARQDLHFVCAGRGVDGSQEDVKRLVERPEMAGRVHFLGEVDNAAEVLAGLDVLCSASRAEAFSNVIGEAMACGVPCVVTDVGDSALIVGDTGVVVGVGDVGGMVEGIGALVDGASVGIDRAGSSARTYLGERYSIASVGRSFVRLYEAGHEAR